MPDPAASPSERAEETRRWTLYVCAECGAVNEEDFGVLDCRDHESTCSSLNSDGESVEVMPVSEHEAEQAQAREREREAIVEAGRAEIWKRPQMGATAMLDFIESLGGGKPDG